MTTQYSFLERLGLDEDADERTIRRAYARELKGIDQEADAAGFQVLREAYETALQWVNWKQQASAVQTDVVQPPVADLPETTLLDEGRAVDSLIAVEPVETSPNEFAPDVAAREVFGDLLQRLASSASASGWTSDTLHRSYLNGCLEDRRLDSIASRDIFEWFVAELLAEGWQPGHEALLVAASNVFDWRSDRQRLSRFGRVGEILDRAIIEKSIYDNLPEAEKARQRNLIARLRDTSPPSRGELIAKMELTEFLLAQYPVWLQLITSMENVQLWRELDRKIPSWRRKLAFRSGKSGARLPSSGAPDRTGVGLRWVTLILSFLIIRGILSLVGSNAPESAAIRSTNYSIAAQNSLASTTGANLYPSELPETQWQRAQSASLNRGATFRLPSTDLGQGEIKIMQMDWARQIQERIRSNVVLPLGLPRNASVVFSVVQQQNGKVIEVVLVQSSGYRNYDVAMEQAIHKSSPLPIAPYEQVFSQELRLRFTPGDDGAR